MAKLVGWAVESDSKGKPTHILARLPQRVNRDIIRPVDSPKWKEPISRT